MAVCKHFNCLPTDDKFKNLSFYQKIMLYDTVIEEKKDNTILIKHCLDALKPWLDKDMYFSMKDNEKNERINKSYKSKEIDDDLTRDIKYVDDDDDNTIIVE